MAVPVVERARVEGDAAGSRRDQARERAQQRGLAGAVGTDDLIDLSLADLGVDVLDRTSVILEIFHRHAKTREARLQVEIARLRYLAPRLREGGGGGDRVRGGVGGKGAYFVRGSGHDKHAAYTEDSDAYQEVVDRLKRLGIEVKTASSSVDEDTADKLKLYSQLTRAMQQEIDRLMPT